MKIIKLATVFSLLLMYGCNAQDLKTFESTDEHFNYSGRFEYLQEGGVGLIGSAAYVEFIVEGDVLNIRLQSESAARNYYVLRINDAIHKRSVIKGDTVQTIAVKLPHKGKHTIGIYKATEAFNDKIIFHGIEAKSLMASEKKPFTIEFIGDSITCGALSDASEMPCIEGAYQDHHNAYMAYGPVMARELNADVLLSCVSGIGMYRNWNDEHIDEPIMPQVYDNLYLNTDASKPFNASYQPDITSICLGTNDMSSGDGTKERLVFNSEKFTENYIAFVEHIYAQHPKTKVILLNSPMVEAQQKKTLMACLKKVHTYFKNHHNKTITIVEFDKIYANGCSAHPSVSDHKAMAEALLPDFKSLLQQ
ncbi:SGNH/GDSL hydrolase family protein [Sediminibacter sp. Hel_I_10]|uniref:SGNH/GDSL hydrolase family protein n=1 Tax=Sediminibacter sp. Hel_I_10 TaxID=1392490 RepID=UPI000690CCE8|nr:SGNH/GDSL hydrolase family protein [Sediminibacter sp. Hel_I_10]